MNRERAFQILDELLSKSSLDPQLREAINLLMDESVVDRKKATLFEKALKEAEDRIAALHLDLGIKKGEISPLRPQRDASVTVIGVTGSGGTMG